LWAHKPKELYLFISPPFWKQTWFFISLFIIFSGGFGFLIKRLSERKLGKKIEVLKRQRELEKERSRISRDMHDEIGSGLSRIAILSELALQSENIGIAAQQQLEKISQSSRVLIDNIGEIIWSLNPENDSVAGLIAFMNQFGKKYFEDLPFDFAFNFTESVYNNHTPISHKLRRNIFLVYKEILHNILKHSKASVIKVFIIDEETNKIVISVSDNGTGIDIGMQNQINQNGFQNMKKRMEEINGTIAITSLHGKGTIIQFSVGI